MSVRENNGNIRWLPTDNCNIVNGIAHSMHKQIMVIANVRFTIGVRRQWEYQFESKSTLNIGVIDNYTNSKHAAKLSVVVGDIIVFSLIDKILTVSSADRNIKQFRVSPSAILTPFVDGVDFIVSIAEIDQIALSCANGLTIDGTRGGNPTAIKVNGVILFNNEIEVGEIKVDELNVRRLIIGGREFIPESPRVSLSGPDPGALFTQDLVESSNIVTTPFIPPVALTPTIPELASLTQLTQIESKLTNCIQLKNGKVPVDVLPFTGLTFMCNWDGTTATSDIVSFTLLNGGKYNKFINGHPDGANPITAPPGQYFIVSTSHNICIDNCDNWTIGDYIVANGISWVLHSTRREYISISKSFEYTLFPAVPLLVSTEPTYSKNNKIEPTYSKNNKIPFSDVDILIAGRFFQDALCMPAFSIAVHLGSIIIDIDIPNSEDINDGIVEFEYKCKAIKDTRGIYTSSVMTINATASRIYPGQKKYSVPVSDIQFVDWDVEITWNSAKSCTMILDTLHIRPHY